MSPPTVPQVDPADLWDWLVSRGMAGDDATKHVLRYVQNSPAEVRRQYLKDLDPGKLASFGLGAADMASFGLGDQIARQLVPGAADVQAAAQAEHPVMHGLGEVAGFLTPMGLEAGLTKAGVKLITPLGRAARAVTNAVKGIQNRPGRALAQSAVRAVEGASYAGAQAAGRTEGTGAERLHAAKGAAPYGAAANVALPVVLAGAKASVGGFANRFLDNLAGPAMPKAAARGVPAAPAPGLLGPESPPPSPMPAPTVEVPGPEAVLRAQLLKAGIPAENVEAMVRTQLQGRGAMPYGPPQGLLTPEGPPPMQAIPGTEGRGFSVSGPRATPTVPVNQPTLAEMSGMANLQSPSRGLLGASPGAGAGNVEPQVGREEMGYAPRQVWNYLEGLGLDPSNSADKEIMKDAARRVAGTAKANHWNPRQGLALLISLLGANAARRSQRP